uniref:Cytochrome P450 CYP71D380 n=1 Tax=Plectranthus barbatus TaxID=41228 RepID=A0A1B0VRK1_9LAMI|nr:cytochrome P450 CYP71D380 [Plectranthus barbatus]
MAIQFASNFITFLLSMMINGSKKVKAPNVERLPPGPPKLPVIGHLHHIIGSQPHHHPLRNLATKYGPVMHLEFGEVSTIIISSAEAARMVLKTHDPACADRPKTMAAEIMWYNCSDIMFSPYGDYWRQMRKICITELLSAKNVRSFEHIREDEASLLIASIRSTRGQPFDLTRKIFLFMNSMTCRAAFGNASMDRAAAIELIKQAFGLVGHFDLADLFPSIKLFSFISNNKLKLLKMRRELDKILDGVIDEHRDNRSSTKKGYGELGTEDLVDVLLRLKESDQLHLPITNDGVKAVIFVSNIVLYLSGNLVKLSNSYINPEKLGTFNSSHLSPITLHMNFLQDMFAAGTETASTTVDWAMAELMKNPSVMAKAQREIRRAFSGRNTIKESEIRTLKYLKLVVNETLRLHPPVSIIPRASREEFEMEGHHIPLNANIIVNIWSIGRDPKYWQNPESFEPERFEKSPIDFLGSDFEYIPFGSGKRVCPGMRFGVASIEFLLAQLLYHFDWKLPTGIGGDDMDMAEADGITVSRKSPLRLIAEPYLPVSG